MPVTPTEDNSARVDEVVACFVCVEQADVSATCATNLKMRMLSKAYEATFSSAERSSTLAESS